MFSQGSGQVAGSLPSYCCYNQDNKARVPVAGNLPSYGCYNQENTARVQRARRDWIALCRVSYGSISARDMALLPCDFAQHL